MNKKITAQRFLDEFFELEKRLAPGERLTVTRSGKVIGHFAKATRLPRIQLPDFEKDASRPGFDTKVGDQLLARLLREEIQF